MNVTMKQQSLELQEQLKGQVPSEILNIFLAYAEKLGDSDFAERAKKVGDIAPEFSLLDATGELISLRKYLKKGPVVLTFYRGNWCPWCNLQLNALQKILPDINEFGATIVAVSPQTPDNSLSMKEKHELSFPVLSDLGNITANEYGLAFEIDKEIIENAYKKINLLIPQFNGSVDWKIPTPGTFIIDQTGVIRSSHVNGDFRYRQEPTAILDALRLI